MRFDWAFFESGSNSNYSNSQWSRLNNGVGSSVRGFCANMIEGFFVKCVAKILGS